MFSVSRCSSLRRHSASQLRMIQKYGPGRFPDVGPGIIQQTLERWHPTGDNVRHAAAPHNGSNRPCIARQNMPARSFASSRIARASLGEYCARSFHLAGKRKYVLRQCRKAVLIITLADTMPAVPQLQYRESGFSADIPSVRIQERARS